MKSLNEFVHEAVAELHQKSLNTIQVETAFKWGGRALAARALGRPEQEVTEYAHEAIEHAALSGDDNVLKTLRNAFRQYRITV
jgi:hypothetical protein